MPSLKLPSDQQHILLIGKNGSGKTRAAVWHLAQKDLEREQWFVINHKREEMINSIPGAVFMGMDKVPPKGKNGVYIYTPKPGADDAAVDALLGYVYDTENIGTYIDEGYMISPRSNELNSLYTQGRSKHCPVITLSQRPAYISRLAVSEATFFQVFNLIDRRDRKLIGEFLPCDLERLMVPQGGNPRLLKDYHSVYYDTRGNEAIIALPVPGDEEILEIFAEKLRPKSEIPVGKLKML